MTPQRAPAALIFDMDELLVQSSTIWKSAEETLLAALGQQWTTDLSSRYKGMNALDVARTIHEIFRPSRSVADCQTIMRDALITGFGGQVQPMPGAVDLVNRVHGRVPLAIASGSPLTAIEYALAKLRIRQCFDVVITSESVARGKPNPDVFLAAAAALKTHPSDCLVFEDSLVGVRAAKAAGMRCFTVPSLPVPEISALADRSFTSLTAINTIDVFPA